MIIRLLRWPVRNGEGAKNSKWKYMSPAGFNVLQDNGIQIKKYNNAKRSIPAHPTFVNGNHRDIHLWTMTSKINRVYHG